MQGKIYYLINPNVSVFINPNTASVTFPATAGVSPSDQRSLKIYYFINPNVGMVTVHRGKHWLIVCAEARVVQ